MVLKSSHDIESGGIAWVWNFSLGIVKDNLVYRFLILCDAVPVVNCFHCVVIYCDSMCTVVTTTFNKYMVMETYVWWSFLISIGMVVFYEIVWLRL